jgi:hypothetical protein
VIVAPPYTIYGVGNIHIDLFSNNGPSQSTPNIEFWEDPSKPISVDLGTFQQDPNNLFATGPYNDMARSVAFSGPLAGMEFNFYDSPSQSVYDDYTTVQFLQNPPSGYSYFLWTFETSYQDAYVSVVYHHYNGLDEKVSSINSILVTSVGVTAPFSTPPNR